MTIQQRLQKCLKFLVNIIYLPLVMTTFIGAVVILDQRNHGLSKTGILLVDLLILVALLLFVFRNKVLCMIHMICSNKMIKRLLLTVMLTALVLWQISCIYYLNGTTGCDPHILLSAATKHPGNSQYFSINPNNLFILYILHYLWIIFWKTSIQTFNALLAVINVILVDGGMFITWHVTSKITNKKGLVNIAIFLYIACFAIFPWFVIPYSDIPALFLCLLNLDLLINIIQKKTSKVMDYCLAGICMAISYLIKPSSIIIYIAGIVIVVLYLNRKNWYRLISKLIIFLVIASSSIFITNQATTNGKLVKIDSSRAFSPWHFVDMGLANDGQYNEADVKSDMKIRSASRRKQHDVKVARQRLKAHGFFGYQQFLYNKQEKNSSDGSLGWAKKAGFLFLIRIPAYYIKHFLVDYSPLMVLPIDSMVD